MNLTPKNKPLEHNLMVVNHYNALKYVLKLAEARENLTIDSIKTLSSLILKGTGGPISSMAGEFDSSKGDFRKATVRTVGMKPIGVKTYAMDGNAKNDNNDRKRKETFPGKAFLLFPFRMKNTVPYFSRIFLQEG